MMGNIEVWDLRKLWLPVLIIQIMINSIIDVISFVIDVDIHELMKPFDNLLPDAFLMGVMVFIPSYLLAVLYHHQRTAYLNREKGYLK